MSMVPVVCGCQVSSSWPRSWGCAKGGLLELRRSDIDGVTGRIKVSRKVDKDVVTGAAGRLPAVRSGHQRPKDGERCADRSRPAAIPAEHLLQHAAAGPQGLLFPGDRTDHERALADRPLPPSPKGSLSSRPNDPPPASHRVDPGRPARCDPDGASGPCRTCLAGDDGDLPTRHARPRQSNWQMPSATATRAGPERRTVVTIE